MLSELLLHCGGTQSQNPRGASMTPLRLLERMAQQIAFEACDNIAILQRFLLHAISAGSHHSIGSLLPADLGGQVLFPYLTVDEQGKTLHDVPQFSDIARPGIC